MDTNTSLGHVPSGDKWAFDEGVARVFDDMLRRSIPDYEGMRSITFSLASRFLDVGDTILDLGCANGSTLAPFVECFVDTCKYLGVDVSVPMIEQARGRFPWCESLAIEFMDLRHEYPAVEAKVTLAILTIQFIPIEYRQSILRRVYERTARGGAFFMVEKTIGSDHAFDSRFVEWYLNHKMNNGYSREEVDRKRLSLEGVLVPVTSAMNEDLLRKAGFPHVETYWRQGPFVGYLAIKD